MNYLRIYNQLIEKRKLNQPTDEYTENHHIIPKWMNGTDEENNLVRLTLREHFFCHLLLWKYYKTVSAANACLALFPAIDLKMERRTPIGITKIVSVFRRSIYSARSGMVFVTDVSGIRCWITSKEYHDNKDKFNVPSSGRVTCVDTLTNKTVSVSVDVFYANKHRYRTTDKKRRQRYYKDGQTALFVNGEVPDGWIHWRKGTPPTNKGIPSGLVPVINIETNEKELVSKEEYKRLKRVKYIHITANSKKSPESGFVRVYFVETGTTGSVTKDEYNKFKGVKYVHASQIKRMKEKGII